MSGSACPFLTGGTGEVPATGEREDDPTEPAMAEEEQAGAWGTALSWSDSLAARRGGHRKQLPAIASGRRAKVTKGDVSARRVVGMAAEGCMPATAEG